MEDGFSCGAARFRRSKGPIPGPSRRPRVPFERSRSPILPIGRVPGDSQDPTRLLGVSLPHGRRRARRRCRAERSSRSFRVNRAFPNRRESDTLVVRHNFFEDFDLLLRLAWGVRMGVAKLDIPQGGLREPALAKWLSLREKREIARSGTAFVGWKGKAAPGPPRRKSS